ncbi:uncharacterized protein ARMOST_17380 [Armillaria ostoyae]|uniref:RING-type domain-containing protein n=1 Tax=Armillaria ostoyae TaxID=47428 RepID=A0A284RYT4_ARMOS|nr:uncharacterized protein ARMOST_17380 [Armillaria ostoyae]
MENNTPAPSQSTEGPSKKRRVLPSADVVEISSDEDEKPLRKKRDKIFELEHLVIKMKEDNYQAKKAQRITEKKLAQYEEELVCLRLESDRLTMKPSQLNDNTTCEICATYMWSPYLLPECGHTFCQTCIRDWFATTKRGYSLENPEYHPTDLIEIPEDLLETMLNYAFDRDELATLSSKIAALGGGPVYSCPICRRAVENPPVEIYAMKSIVRVVAAAQGESSPSKAVPRRNLSRRNPVQGEHSWVDFFPARKSNANLV